MRWHSGYKHHGNHGRQFQVEHLSLVYVEQDLYTKYPQELDWDR